MLWNHPSLEQTPAKQVGNPQQAPLEKRAIKGHSSLTVSRRQHLKIRSPLTYQCIESASPHKKMPISTGPGG
jgi:hypothetical protein